MSKSLLGQPGPENSALVQPSLQGTRIHELMVRTRVLSKESFTLEAEQFGKGGHAFSLSEEQLAELHEFSEVTLSLKEPIQGEVTVLIELPLSDRVIDEASLNTLRLELKPRANGLWGLRAPATEERFDQVTAEIVLVNARAVMIVADDTEAATGKR